MNNSTVNSEAAKSPAEAPLSREGEAQRDLCGTAFAPGARAVLIIGFLLLLAVGFGAAWSGLSGLLKNRSGSSEVHALGNAPGSAAAAPPLAQSPLLQWLPTPETTRAIEKALVESSALVGRLRPWAQYVMVRLFGQGNSQAVVARDGWLFFRKDLDYVNGRPFLDPLWQRERQVAGQVAADPLPAILEFQSQLAERGIRLVLMPVPVKPCIEGHRFDRDSGAATRLRHNASFGAFLEALRVGGIEVFDPAPLLLERLRQTREPQFLARDTHWTPQAMEAVAHALARAVEGAPVGNRGPGAGDAVEIREPTLGRASEAPAFEERRVTANGDTVALLGLPQQQALFLPETVTTRVVSSGGGVWQSNPGAEVLLLGDSFSNIFSFREMGWGEQAGLAEHLSAALRKPVDALLRNSDGAFATRQMLQQELAKGRDRLAGKKVVVWEFAVRELALGDWKSLPLHLGAGASLTFYCPPAGARARVEGTVARLSAVPRPGSVPYKEHVMSVLLVDVAVDNGPVEPGRQCLVYTWSMRDLKPARGASLRLGERVAWELSAWEDVQATREKFQRSEFEEPSFLLEPFAWAE